MESTLDLQQTLLLKRLVCETVNNTGNGGVDDRWESKILLDLDLNYNLNAHTLAPKNLIRCISSLIYVKHKGAAIITSLKVVLNEAVHQNTSYDLVVVMRSLA